MKKTLIALAALAATSAFAQVTITGTMDLTYRASSATDTAGAESKTTGIGKDGIGTTGFILSGNEDLGGGLKAVFLYEHNFEPYDTGVTTASYTPTLTTTGTAAATVSSLQSNGQMFVGLEGAFGSVKFGAPNTPSLTVQGLRAGSFGTKDGGRAALGAGGYTTMMGLALTRFDSSVNYTSPNFSGFSFGVTYVPETDNAATPSQGALSDIGAFYNNGPLSVGVSAYSQDVGTVASTTDKTEVTSYAATYNFGFAKIGLGGHEYKKGAAKNSGLNVVADVPLSPSLTLTANVQQVNDKSANNLDADQFAIGLQYALSKRTLAYARYIDQSADATSGTKDADRFLVGLRHNF
jgi:predicted porin